MMFACLRLFFSLQDRESDAKRGQKHEKQRQNMRIVAVASQSLREPAMIVPRPAQNLSKPGTSLCQRRQHRCAKTKAPVDGPALSHQFVSGGVTYSVTALSTSIVTP
ncbi:MAG: hypothetical protein WAO69_02405 [Aestuariivita sp.]|uniref:hypothetical protein n=1 Tax=Aestuariivita sp. TaxID=1872407 RepID=UPI003BB104E9